MGNTMPYYGQSCLLCPNFQDCVYGRVRVCPYEPDDEKSKALKRKA